MKATTPTECDPFCSLARLAMRRLLVGDKVAAAKYGTPTGIDDPQREHDVLDEVTRRSMAMGLDPVISTTFFRAQIEANKVLQRRLHDLWRASPHLRPPRRPDLAAEVRPELDEITGEMLRQLKALTARPRGNVRVAAAEIPDRLDPVHREALEMALTPLTTIQ